MTQKQCSYARLQKFSFCKRAFYFHYHLSEDDFPHPLYNEIDKINQNSQYYLALFQLKRAALKLMFYRRALGHHEIKRELAQQGLFHNLDKISIESTLQEASYFVESSFYHKTNPAFIKHFETNDISSFFLEDIEMLGNIDFSWYDQSGVNLVCLASKQNSQAKINFMLCYALRHLGAEIDKINIGLLKNMNNNWECEWQAVNWHEYQEYIDSILCFSPPADVLEATPTNSQLKCNICEYKHVCEDFSDTLDN